LVQGLRAQRQLAEPEVANLACLIHEPRISGSP
jgi:hypothetical protein